MESGDKMKKIRSAEETAAYKAEMIVKKAAKSEKMKDKNIKAAKYPVILGPQQRQIFDYWIVLGKELYNLLVNQRIEAEKYSQEQYFLAHPEKALERARKDGEHQAKVEKEILEGKRKPKKVHLTPFLSHVQMRHEGLRNINTDVITFTCGASTIEELILSHDGEIYTNKNGIKSIRLSWQQQQKYLTTFKKVCPEFAVMPAIYLNNICKQVDQAWKKYESNKASYSKKPTKRFPKAQFVHKEDDFSLKGAEGVDNNSRVRVAALKGQRNARVYGIDTKRFPQGIKIVYFKPVPGDISVTALVKEGSKYFLNLTFQETKKHWPSSSPHVGIDLGITRNIQLSTGDYFNLPIDQIKELENKKKKAQRGLKNKEINSKNYKKAQKKIAKIDAKMAALKKYHTALFATEIVRKHEIIIVESLAVKNMTKSAKGTIDAPGKRVAQKSGLNKAFLRVAPYAIKLALKQKAAEYSRTFIEVPPAYTSLDCSGCGHRSHKNESRLTQSDYICSQCGLEINADHNAAINILNKGLAYIKSEDQLEDAI